MDSRVVGWEKEEMGCVAWSPSGTRCVGDPPVEAHPLLDTHSGSCTFFPSLFFDSFLLLCSLDGVLPFAFAILRLPRPRYRPSRFFLSPGFHRGVLEDTIARWGTFCSFFVKKALKWSTRRKKSPARGNRPLPTRHTAGRCSSSTPPPDLCSGDDAGDNGARDYVRYASPPLLLLLRLGRPSSPFFYFFCSSSSCGSAFEIAFLLLEFARWCGGGGGGEKEEEERRKTKWRWWKRIRNDEEEKSPPPPPPPSGHTDRVWRLASVFGCYCFHSGGAFFSSFFLFWRGRPLLVPVRLPPPSQSSRAIDFRRTDFDWGQTPRDVFFFSFSFCVSTFLCRTRLRPGLENERRHFLLSPAPDTTRSFPHPSAAMARARSTHSAETHTRKRTKKKTKTIVEEEAAAWSDVGSAIHLG